MYKKVTGRTKKEFDKVSEGMDPIAIQSVIETVESNLIVSDVVKKHKGWTVQIQGLYVIFRKSSPPMESVGFHVDSLGQLIKTMEHRVNEIKKVGMQESNGEEFEGELNAIYEDLKVAHKDWIKQRGRDTIL